MLLHKSVEFDSRVRREASALAAAGHKVIVLELSEIPDADRTLDGFTRSSCLPSVQVGQKLPAPLCRLLTLLLFVIAIMKIRPDIVHAHDAPMLLPGLIGARLTGARIVYDSHEFATSVPYRDGAWAWFVGAIERAVIPRCAAVITVSDGIAARLMERYRLSASPTVVRNVSALATNGTGELRLRLGLDREVPLVLHQGAPAPDRGCEALVAAAALLDDVHVVFLGDPEAGYGEELSEVIRRRGVGGRVTLLPSVPLDDLLSYTAEADVGVTLLQDTCENHRLALPNKLFEYIAAEVPVVASALPEVQRLIDVYGIGWCVPPGDPVELARALSRGLRARHDPELAGRLGRASVELHWSLEQTRLLELYAELTDGGLVVRRARSAGMGDSFPGYARSGVEPADTVAV